MKRCLITLLALSGAGVSSPSYAALLIYYYSNGRAVIDPTDGGANPTGKVLGYNLASNGRFFVDPARMSAFPPPSPMFFENTTSVIGDNDLALAGTSNVIDLGVLFSPPIPLRDLFTVLTNRIYVPSLGGGEVLIEIAYTIAEPATFAQGAVAVFGLAAIRRRRTGRLAA